VDGAPGQRTDELTALTESERVSRRRSQTEDGRDRRRMNRRRSLTEEGRADGAH